MSNPSKNRVQPPDPAEGTPGAGVSTGSLALDLKLGTGGWPRGRIVEIYGPEGCGKTTLLLEAIAQAQRNGGLGAFIDADHATTQATAARLGIDLERMPFHRTNKLEEAFAKIEELVLGGAVDVIALDTISALMPEGWQNCADVPVLQDQEHQHKIEHYLKVLLGPLSRSRAVLLIANHVRERVGMYFGNPETTPWVTMPLRDYASQRIDLRRMAAIKDGDDALGIEVRARIVKNRFAAPVTQAQFQMYFASGICGENDLIALGLEVGLVSKRGNRFAFGEVPLGMGQREAVRALKQDAELAGRLREGIIERMRE
jgi:recombination protein RecA